MEPPMPIRRPNDFSTGVYNRGPGRQSAAADHHDVLHMQKGLMYCHCMCSHCWDKNQARCICLQCPCTGVKKSSL